ncbi:unnamed protein product [Calypogeia fissa]
MVFPRVGIVSLLLQALVLQYIFALGESGVVIHNHSNETAVTVSVYDGALKMVLEIGLLDAGSIIDWDAKGVYTNYSSPWKSSSPVPMEHLFVIRNAHDNDTVAREYFYDGTSVTILDDSMGGLSIKASGSRD